MRSRIPLIAVAALVAAAALFWFVRRPGAPSRTAAAPPQTASTPQATPKPSASPFEAGEEQSQRQLVQDILSKGLTPDRARWYFSMAVGPLPGVTVPPGVQRDLSDFDGTSAIWDIYNVWSSLTPEQQQAVDRLVNKPQAAQPAKQARMGGLGFLAARYWFPVVSANSGLDYKKLLEDANSTLADHLKVDPLPDDAYTFDVDYDTPPGTAYAETNSWFQFIKGDAWFKRPDGCHITFWDQKIEPWDPVVGAAVATHEMFHCYQDRAIPDVTKRKTVLDWVNEGEATWVMVAAIPSAAPVVQQHWTPYIDHPEKKFNDRKYDAIGIFGHMSDLVGDEAVWLRLFDVLKADINASDTNALDRLVQGRRDTYLSTWGASYFRVSDHPVWNMRGPGYPQETGPAPAQETVSADDAKFLPSVPPYTAQVTNVSGSADIVTVSLLTGYGRLHDAKFSIDTELDSAAPLALCLKQGGCKCPDGSEGASLVTQEAQAPLSIGLEGGDTTAQASVSGASLDKFCKKPDEPGAGRPQAPGGGGNGGGTPDGQSPEPQPNGGSAWGDPHVETFDGARMEFQKLGEYTLVRSTKDDFVVQVRQVPVVFSRSASVNKAVATRIGGHRATVTEENGQIVLRLDGKAVTGDPPMLQGGAITRALTAYGTNFTFEWPDGTVLHADQLAGYAINVRVVPSAARRGTLEGLLGNDDGKPDNDETAVAALADKWRVTKATSLFDYLPGQTTATFIDPTFPDPGDGVKDHAKAERDCREEGITDPQLLHDCIIDFGITNGFLFREQYAHQQTVLAARAALMPVAAVRGAAETRSVLMAGTITDSKVTPELTFDAKAGDVIYMAQGPDCLDRASDWWNNKPNTLIYFTLYGPDGKPVGLGRPGCELGRWALQATGTYTMRANERKNEIGPYHVPIHFVRHDRLKAIAYGDIVSGTIEQPGAHDLYTFTAKAGDIVQIAGKGCQLASGLYTGIIRPAEWPTWRSQPQAGAAPGPNCSQGSVAKIDQDGTYALLINNADAGVGSYQFVFQGVSSK